VSETRSAPDRGACIVAELARQVAAAVAAEQLAAQRAREADAVGRDLVGAVAWEHAFSARLRAQILREAYAIAADVWRESGKAASA
jgi:hypothetical protein